jgi:hypothetical protein
MNSYLRWYQRAVWFGICFNMTFAVVALYRPATLQRSLKLRPLEATVWLRNVGMLLVLVSIFNAGAALQPTRYPLYSYLVAVARLIAGFFFFRVVYFNPHQSSDNQRSFMPLFVFDTTMGVLCALLLKLGLQEHQQVALDLTTLRSRFRR